MIRGRFLNSNMREVTLSQNNYEQIRACSNSSSLLKIPDLATRAKNYENRETGKAAMVAAIRLPKQKKNKETTSYNSNNSYLNLTNR